MTTEYIPCLLKREIDPYKASFEVTFLSRHVTKLTPVPTYKETLIPCELGDVSVFIGKKEIRKGPFKISDMPEWAKRWFSNWKKQS